MSAQPDAHRERRRMERALAALAGSGLDSSRFVVLLDPSADPEGLDRSMTAVLAVIADGLVGILNHLNLETEAAWVADPSADPNLDPSVADDVMCRWHFGTAAGLRTGPPADGDRSGWLVIGAEAPTPATDAQLLAAIEVVLERGESPSRTAKAVAANFGVPKRRVYDLVLALDTDR